MHQKRYPGITEVVIVRNDVIMSYRNVSEEQDMKSTAFQYFQYSVNFMVQSYGILFLVIVETAPQVIPSDVSSISTY